MIEALRTRFISSMNNESVLKALFKVKDDEIKIVVKAEDAAKDAKETVYGSKPTQSVHKVTAEKFSKKTASKSKDSDQRKLNIFAALRLISNHVSLSCRFKDAVCLLLLLLLSSLPAFP